MFRPLVCGWVDVGEEPLLLPALGPVFRWVIGACLLALLLKMIEVKFT